MPITKGFRQLVDEANACITTYSVTQVRERLADGRMQLVDIRDIREMLGKIFDKLDNKADK